MTFREYGLPVRRTKRRKSKKKDVQEFWDSRAQNKTSKSQKMDFQDFWDSCAQNKTSEISKHALSGILVLLCAEQNVGKLNKLTSKNSGTPVRRTKPRKSKQMHFQEFWDSCAQNKASEISTNPLLEILGLLCAEQTSEI